MSSEVDPYVGYVLKRAQHALRARMDHALKPLGLTAPQYAALKAIEHEPGISNARLSRAVFVTPQTMQAIVSNLEKGRYLKRTAHPSHGRILKGELTPHGRQVLQQAHQIVDEIERAMLASLTPKDARLLAELLLQCCANLADESIVRNSGPGFR